MGKINLFLTLILILITFVNAQNHRTDNRTQIQKNDSNNEYESDEITNLDILRAFEISGIRINKFYLGEFDKKYKLSLSVDEYKWKSDQIK